jgi:hypothetical protein
MKQLPAEIIIFLHQLYELLSEHEEETYSPEGLQIGHKFAHQIRLHMQ